MKATVQFIVKTDHIGHENDVWIFRTNKERSEICDIEGFATQEFMKFLEENYKEEIYNWIADEYDYEILYIYDEHAHEIDF